MAKGQARPDKPPRHAELGSASILRPALSVLEAQWNLEAKLSKGQPRSGDEGEGRVRGAEIFCGGHA